MRKAVREEISTVFNEVTDLKSSMVSIPERVALIEMSTLGQPAYSQAAALSHEVRYIHLMINHVIVFCVPGS